MLELHAVFLTVVVGTELFFAALALLNVRHGAATVVERMEWVTHRLGIDDTERLLAYQRAGTGLSLLRSAVGLALVLLVLYSGLFGDAVAALEGVALPPVARGVVFFAGLVGLVQVAGAPFSLYETFAVEEQFGFNQQSPRLWLRDFVVSLAVSIVLTVIVAGGVLLILELFPDWWWVGAWGLFVAFSLAMLVIYPRVIAPLFYEFEPIESGDLRDAVEDVFERAGFACEQVYQMDASSRSSHSNAYFVGFGRTKRVVLFDTLIDQMDREEIKSVLAHELAHWKQGHIWKQLASSALRIGVVLAVFSILIEQSWVYEMFGAPETAYAGLALGVLWIEPLVRLSAPVENKLSLAHEREADSFAVEVMGGGSALADALANLTSENLANPFPHPLYATFHYTHPPIPERIRYIERESDENAASTVDPVD
ncbi:M48 family metallopeptidase [Halapricum hydrolyticum]|uniref:M48 family metallopeptidase n=1 Tax=Halapricum hydrolyticum TaxID=2979991 RepID=A0AAE3IF54_9EURY|nr:M48 family metallopeptidase [Halapricum hydrolyticum]MCU4719293.1 M48 family metallopeptidase [Halapricum hydrolyticum]MCU4728168.1 M48 family metallopeptidase [Halapricum hydrolyticum]